MSVSQVSPEFTKSLMSLIQATAGLIQRYHLLLRCFERLLYNLPGKTYHFVQVPVWVLGKGTQLKSYISEITDSLRYAMDKNNWLLVVSM